LRKKKSKIGINKNAKISIILVKIYIKNKMLKLEKAKIKGNRLMSSQLHFKKPTASVKGFGVWGIGVFPLDFWKGKTYNRPIPEPRTTNPRAVYFLYNIQRAGGLFGDVVKGLIGFSFSLFKWKKKRKKKKKK